MNELKKKLKTWFKKEFDFPQLWIVLAGAWAGAVTLGQLQRFQTSSSLAFYFHDQVLLIVWVCALLSGKLRSYFQHVMEGSRQYRAVTFSIGVVTLWLLAGWAMAAVNGYDVLRPVLGVIRLVFYLGGVLILAKNVAAQRWQRILTVIFGLVVWLGWLQYVFLPDIRWLAALGWDDHYYRAIGSLLDPGFLGLWLVLAIIWLTQLLLPYRVKILSLMATLSLLVVTYSRASWLSLVAAIGVIVLSYYPRQISSRLLKSVVILLLTLVFTWVVAPKPSGEGVNVARTSTVAARLNNSEQWLGIFTPSQLIVGKGFGVQGGDFQTQALTDHSHWSDSVVVSLVSGLGLGAGWILGLLYVTRRWWLRWPGWLKASWVAVLVHSQFNHSLTEPLIWMMLWALTASHLKSSTEK